MIVPLAENNKGNKPEGFVAYLAMFSLLSHV